jgi:hypothetical protein
MASGGYAGYSLPLPKSSMMPGSWSLDQGVDIPAGANTPEYAIGPGVITQEGISGFGPNAPILRVTAGPLAGTSFYYGHAGPDLVRVGQSVAAGQQISEVGAGIVGISSGPHIEFGIWPPRGGAAVAPILQALMGGAGVTGIPGAGAAMIPTPAVTGTGAIADIARGTIAKLAGAANAYLTAKGGGLGAAGVAGFASGAGVAPGSWLTVAQQLAAKHGWGASEIQAWQQLEGIEDGSYSLTARNPSGAYGLAQFINGPGEYAQYGGNASTIVGQLTGMANYIAQRYTTPSAALAHELANNPHWYSGGGFATDAKFPSKVIKPPKTKLSKPAKAPKGVNTGMTTKDMQGLSRVGGTVNGLETAIAKLSGQYQADQTLFSPQEAQAQYLNADGSLNPAGYAKLIADDQTLLAIDQQLLGLYKKETPVVSAALKKWLGNQGKTNAKVASNKRKIAANKIREGSLRKAVLDLSKPGPNTVQTIQDQIKQTRLGWEGKTLAAEKAKLGFDESSVPREMALEQAVINAQRKKLGYSAINHADALKRGVLSAEAAEKGYGGTDHATKQALSVRVNQARQRYSDFLLNQAPVKAAITAKSSGAALNLRQYLLSEKPTQQQLTDAVSNTRLSQRSALLPLEGALLAAQVAQQKRAQKIKTEKFGLSQQLGSLTREDTRLSQADTRLTGILTGANGGQSTNQTVNVLETVAGKLGMVNWSSGGNFAGIDTSMPGEIVSVTADIQTLTNSIGTAQRDQSGAAASSTDNTQLVSLLQQQNLQLSEALSLNEAQTSVLAGMIPEIPHYEKGGPIIGDQLAMLHDGEHVVPRGGTLVAQGGGQSHTIELHQHLHGDMAGLANFIDQRIQHPDNVRGVSRRLGVRTSMLSGAPGGYRR